MKSIRIVSLCLSLILSFTAKAQTQTNIHNGETPIAIKVLHKDNKFVFYQCGNPYSSEVPGCETIGNPEGYTAESLNKRIAELEQKQKARSRTIFVSTVVGIIIGALGSGVAMHQIFRNVNAFDRWAATLTFGGLVGGFAGGVSGSIVGVIIAGHDTSYGVYETKQVVNERLAEYKVKGYSIPALSNAINYILAGI